MTQSVRHRKPGDRRAGKRARRPVARMGERRLLSRQFTMTLLAMAYGSTIALLVLAVGLTALVRDGVGIAKNASVELQRAGAGDGHDHSTHNHDAGSALNIQIDARHIGNLVLDIEVELKHEHPSRPLTKAKVVAFTDMVQMPGVHTQGPLPMKAMDKPGSYHTQTNLSMPGDYKVRVVVKDPVRGKKITEVPVTTTY